MTKYMKSMHKILTRPVAKMADGGPYIFPQAPNESDNELRSQYPWLPILSDPGASVYRTGTRRPYSMGTIAAPTAGPSATLNQATTGADTPAGKSPATDNGNAFNFSTAMNNFMPFASNVVNSFRKPPMPIEPVYNPMVTLNKVNYDNERNAASREINAANVDAERTVSGNTAQAIKLYNLGNKLNAFSNINEKESNANTQIGNTQAMINAQITAGNNAKKDEFNNSLVERQIAQQTQQAANLANFSDKYVGMQNEKEKAKVDIEKTKVLSSPYMRSGVFQAQARIWKQQGVPDPLGRNYDYLDDKRPDIFGDKKDSKATGGFMRFRSMIKC